MSLQAGMALIVISIVVAAVVILVLLIRESRRLWKPRRLDPQVRFLGHYSPFLTWLKYRRFARMEIQPRARTKIRGHLAALAEAAVIVVWALWVGRNYLFSASSMWLPEDWGLFGISVLPRIYVYDLKEHLTFSYPGIAPLR